MCLREGEGGECQICYIGYLVSWVLRGASTENNGVHIKFHYHILVMESHPQEAPTITWCGVTEKHTLHDPRGAPIYANPGHAVDLVQAQALASFFFAFIALFLFFERKRKT